MKKACLSLIFMSVLAYGIQETKAFTKNTSTHVNLLEYLKAKRPAEQDFRSRHTIPAFAPYVGGKQLVVNWNQVGNIAAILGGVRAFYHANMKPMNHNTRILQGLSLSLDPRNCWEPSQKSFWYGVSKTSDSFRPMQIFATLCTLGFSYRYLNGEQKIPVRLIDTPKTVSTEESN